MADPASTPTFQAREVPMVRAAMSWRLDQLFMEVGQLVGEYVRRERQPRELSTELAAVLPELGQLIEHHDRLGWDSADERGAVTLEHDDALKRALGADKPDGGGA